MPLTNSTPDHQTIKIKSESMTQPPAIQSPDNATIYPDLQPLSKPYQHMDVLQRQADVFSPVNAVDTTRPCTALNQLTHVQSPNSQLSSSTVVQVPSFSSSGYMPTLQQGEEGNSDLPQNKNNMEEHMRSPENETSIGSSSHGTPSFINHPHSQQEVTKSSPSDNLYYPQISVDSFRSPPMSFVRSPHPPYYHMPVPSMQPLTHDPSPAHPINHSPLSAHPVIHGSPPAHLTCYAPPPAHSTGHTPSKGHTSHSLHTSSHAPPPAHSITYIHPVPPSTHLSCHVPSIDKSTPTPSYSAGQAPSSVHHRAFPHTMISHAPPFSHSTGPSPPTNHGRSTTHLPSVTRAPLLRPTPISVPTGYDISPPSGVHPMIPSHLTIHQPLDPGIQGYVWHYIKL